MGKKSTVAGVLDLVAKADKVTKLSGSDAQVLADQVVLQMKDLIAKGISPIKQTGRFPEYLAAGRVKDAKKAAKAFQAKEKAFRADAKTLSGMGEKKLSKEASRRADAARDKKEKLVGDAHQGYPYSVQHKYPGKKPRPVNLYLSGKFLSDLKGKIRNQGDRIVAEVGIYGELSCAKERGHREGANGQPKRPTIPDRRKGEDFSDVIRLNIERFFKNMVKKNR